MGKKRKHDKEKDFSEHLLKKIRKIERKLRKRRRRSSSCSDSTDVESSDPGSDSGKNRSPEESSSESVIICNDSEALPSTSSAPEVSLDEDILTLLGEAPKEESPIGKDIHEDIATRLQDILQNGLHKVLKSKITEEYPIPGNCQLFKAPILNPEIKAAVSDLLHKKDSSIAARQGQIGIALSALATAMNILVSEKSDFNQTLLKHVSNASRLLCDSHSIDSKMRRNFFISTLNNSLKDTLKESKRDKHLFGENLPDKLKANKAISKSSNDLRYNKAKAGKTNTNSTLANLNWKHPQPNMNHKGISSAQPTAGFSTMTTVTARPPRRSDPVRKPNSTRVPRTNAYFRNQKRS